MTRWVIVALLITTVFIPRLVDFGKVLTVDEPLWQGRGEQFIKGLASGHFDKTLTGGQPGVTTTWLVGLALPWKSLTSTQASIAIATGALVLLATYGLVRLWGFQWGMVAGFFLALNPFLLAHSRLVHTDALFALFALTSLIFVLLSREHRRYLFFSALLFGLALLTRSSGIILIPVMVILIRNLKNIFQWGIVIALTVFIFWPALWMNADTVFQFLTQRTALHVASGTHSGETTATWWYYAREGLFRTTPVALLGFIPAAYAFFKRRDSFVKSAAIIFAAGLFFAAVLSFSSDKSDRYILFSLLTLDVFAVAGIRAISPASVGEADSPGVIAGSETGSRVFKMLLVALPVAYLTLEVFLLHPYYLAHYNRLYPIEERHKLGWGEGFEQAAAWVKENDNGAKVATIYPGVFSRWYDGPIDPISHLDDSNAKYVIIYRSMFERGAENSDTEFTNRYLNDPARQAMHVIHINRLPYIWIFLR